MCRLVDGHHGYRAILILPFKAPFNYVFSAQLRSGSQLYWNDLMSFLGYVASSGPRKRIDIGFILFNT